MSKRKFVEDGTSGQDRESYTDDQDRKSYTVSHPTKRPKKKGKREQSALDRAMDKWDVPQV